ncbi:MAG: hypothetical protein GYB36_12845 [Alphaproteobacteria bacterium]|nr:hypothetical protein [Alphaproteobacteria bacterium]
MVERSQKPDIRYSDLSHEALNETRKLTPTPAPFDGPWIKPETLARLPNMARDFQMNRDPLIAKQVRDLEGERDGGGSSATKNDRPRPELKPPPHMRGPWLSAQRDVAMQLAPTPKHNIRSPERTRSAPSRGPER